MQPRTKCKKRDDSGGEKRVRRPVRTPGGSREEKVSRQMAELWNFHAPCLRAQMYFQKDVTINTVFVQGCVGRFTTLALKL